MRPGRLAGAGARSESNRLPSCGPAADRRLENVEKRAASVGARQVDHGTSQLRDRPGRQSARQGRYFALLRAEPPGGRVEQGGTSPLSIPTQERSWSLL